MKTGYDIDGDKWIVEEIDGGVLACAHQGLRLDNDGTRDLAASLLEEIGDADLAALVRARVGGGK